MKVLTTKADLRRELAALRVKGSVGLVPTMGALHAGHISLVERARKECTVVVVSDFVNPTQFNDKNDLKNYPRTLDNDQKLLASAGVDLVFAPSVEEVYPEPDNRVFDFGPIDKVMEGASRPGHFNGVGQVVSRLFDIVEPNRAYFGEKDFQQIAIIKELVRQLGYKIEIVECPIKRAYDGLALSSRNVLLDAEHRQAAPHIYKVLKAACSKVGEMSPAQLEQWVEQQVNSNELLKVVYFQIVDAVTMQRVTSWDEKCAKQGCITVQAGAVRLIDNIRLQ